MSMPIHKFIHKYQRQEESPVVYRPHDNLKYPAKPRDGKWEVFAQESFTIQPRSSVNIFLKFGVLVRRGMVFVSLKQELKLKRCSMQDGVLSETASDIIVTIQNNSAVEVVVNAGDSLCYIGRQAT